MTKSNASLSIPEAMKSHYSHITSLIEPFCQQYLNEEYKQLSFLATAALCRKRPSPLLSGNASTWACGIVYAMGYVNFLFDKSFEPFVTTEQLATAFGISKSTAGNKSKQIRDLLKIHHFDHRWYLPSKLADNPTIWMITVNDLIMDARNLPREIQVIAHEKKLIPYIYADSVNG
jgi:hypothetical protein